jgi:hypothetical protein
MRRLRGGIPRAFTSHKGADGYAYRRYCRAIVERLGELPAGAEVTLREAGRLTVELQACGRELEIARSRKRHRDAARLRKQMTPMRTQLITLEQRLEELAKGARRQNPFAKVSSL